MLEDLGSRGFETSAEPATHLNSLEGLRHGNDDVVFVRL